MTDRLVLDYVASRDRVPAWGRGSPWFTTPKRMDEVDAKFGKMQWRPGPFTGGQIGGIPRPPGADPRSFSLGSEWCLNADAADALGPNQWSYDADDKALVMSARPMTRMEHARLGRPLGATAWSANMHTSHWGCGYGRWEVVARCCGEVGSFGAPLWGQFFGANPDPARGNGYGEIDVIETVGHQRDTVFQTVHYQEYAFEADGVTPKRDGKGVPQHRARTNQGQGTKVGFDIAAGFHEYAVEWDAERIRWLVDGAETFAVATPVSLRGKRLILICGLAVGNNPQWSRGPDASTEWPMTQAIRSIRAWEA